MKKLGLERERAPEEKGKARARGGGESGEKEGMGRSWREIEGGERSGGDKKLL